MKFKSCELVHWDSPGEPLIGFNYTYEDGAVYQSGPVFTQMEWEVVMEYAKQAQSV